MLELSDSVLKTRTFRKFFERYRATLSISCFSKKCIAFTLIVAMVVPQDAMAGWRLFGRTDRAEDTERQEATRALHIPLLELPTSPNAEGAAGRSAGLGNPSVGHLGIPLARRAIAAAPGGVPTSGSPNVGLSPVGSPFSSASQTPNHFDDSLSSDSDSPPSRDHVVWPAGSSVEMHEKGLFPSRHPEETLRPMGEESTWGSGNTARDLYGNDAEKLSEAAPPKPGLLARAGACLRGAGSWLKSKFIRTKVVAPASALDTLEDPLLDPSSRHPEARILPQEEERRGDPGTPHLTSKPVFLGGHVGLRPPRHDEERSDDAEKLVQPGILVEIVGFRPDGTPIFGEEQIFRGGQQLAELLDPNRPLTELEISRARGFFAWAAQQAEEVLPAKPWKDLTKWEKFKRTTYYVTVGAFAIGWSYVGSLLATQPIIKTYPAFKGENGTLSAAVGISSAVFFLLPGFHQTREGFEYLASYKQSWAGRKGWKSEDIHMPRRAAWAWTMLELGAAASLAVIPFANWVLFSDTWLDCLICMLPFVGPIFVDGWQRAHKNIGRGLNWLFRYEEDPIERERAALQSRFKTAAARLKNLSDAELEGLYKKVFEAPPVVELQDHESLEQAPETLEGYEEAVAQQHQAAAYQLWQLGHDDAPNSKVSGWLRGLTWVGVGITAMAWDALAIAESLVDAGGEIIAAVGGSLPAMELAAQIVAPPLALIGAFLVAERLYDAAEDLYNRLAPPQHRSPFAPTNAIGGRGTAAVLATGLTTYAALPTIVLPDVNKSNIGNLFSFLTFSAETAADFSVTVNRGYDGILAPRGKTRPAMEYRLRTWAKTLHDQVEFLPRETVHGVSRQLGATLFSSKMLL